MTPWTLLFKAKSPSEGRLMPLGLRRDIGSMLRVEASYALNVSGIRLLGFELRVQDEEFHHVIQVVRILEARYGLALFEFSAREPTGEASGIAIQVGAKPMLKVA